MRTSESECYKTDILNFLSIAYKMPRAKIERIRKSFDYRAAQYITNEILQALNPVTNKRQEAMEAHGNIVYQSTEFYIDIFNAKMHGEHVDDFKLPDEFFPLERDEKVDELFKNHKVMAHCFYLINLIEARRWDPKSRHYSFLALYDYFTDVIYPTYLVAPTPPPRPEPYQIHSFYVNGGSVPSR